MIYGSQDNRAKLIKNGYVGVDGVARKILKGYVGVDGLARKFYPDKDPLISSWSSGTDEQIINMVQAAYEGLIDLTDYWNVGDERIVHLSAMDEGVGYANETHEEQDIVLVLIDANSENYTYVETPPNGREHPFFIVQQKDCLIEPGRIHNRRNTAGYWANTSRRAWLNTKYRDAFKQNFVDIFKKVNVVSTYWYNKTYYSRITEDYFFLLSSFEIRHIKKISNNVPEYNQVAQMEYFENNNNWIKKKGREKYLGGYWSTRTVWPTDYGYDTMDCVYYDYSTGRSSIVSGITHDETNYYLAPAGAI